MQQQGGLGPEVQTFYKALKANLPGRTIASLPVIYPAADVQKVLFVSSFVEKAAIVAVLAVGALIGPDATTKAAADVVNFYVSHHLNPFLKSIAEGTTSVIDLLTTQASVCPKTQFVLAGYSQGAMAIHRALLKLADTGGNQLIDRIAATVLIADGDRKSNTAALHFGTASKAAEGVRSFFTTGERDVPRPASTYDVCNDSDIVCDFRWNTVLGRANAGGDIHTSYSNSKLVKQVGQRVAAALVSVLNHTGGTVMAWGIGRSGQLGNGGIADSPVPVQVTGLTGVTAIAGGRGNAYALREDGSVWAWGAGNKGGLGSGGTTDSLVPVQVSGLTGVSAIAGGSGTGYAISQGGSVWAWGEGTSGGLGNGSTTDSLVPVQVPGLTGVTAIASGVNGGATYALRADGSVWAWGEGSFGQLGNGSTTDSAVPVQVSGLTGVTAITAGSVNGYALRGDGSVWAWGSGDFGELGGGSRAESLVPVPVAGLSQVTAIAGGSVWAYALRSDSSVWAWGTGGWGELGNGSTAFASVPVPVTGLTGVTAIASSAEDGYALRGDGSVWAWGFGTDGGLGNGSTTNSLVPVQVSGLTGVTVTTIAVSAGTMQGYALIR